MRVKLLTDLVQKNTVLKAGTNVDLADVQANFLISVNRAVKLNAKEDKVAKATKELKTTKKTK